MVLFNSEFLHLSMVNMAPESLTYYLHSVIMLQCSCSLHILPIMDNMSFLYFWLQACETIQMVWKLIIIVESLFISKKLLINDKVWKHDQTTCYTLDISLTYTWYTVRTLGITAVSIIFSFCLVSTFLWCLAVFLWNRAVTKAERLLPQSGYC